MMARLAVLLECYVYESGALVLSVWLLGVMGKPPILCSNSVDTGLTDLDSTLFICS